MDESPEPHMDAVKTEDKPLVRDVIHVIRTLNKCSTWTLNVVPNGYELLCWIRNQSDTDVTVDELDLIQQVNPLRVQFSGVRFFAATGKAALRVHILSQSEPVMLHEQTLVRIRKRSRWWNDKA